MPCTTLARVVRENFILAGHDGPFHLAISSQRPLLRGLALFHGKHGAGVGVYGDPVPWRAPATVIPTARVRRGPVTLLSMTQTRAGDLKLVAAQGESIAGPVLQIGNTDSRPSSGSSGPRYQFLDVHHRSSYLRDSHEYHQQKNPSRHNR